MHLRFLSACKRTEPLCPSRHSTPADIQLRGPLLRDRLQLTRQPLIATPFLAGPWDPIRQVTRFSYKQLISVIKYMGWRGGRGGAKKVAGTPPSQELCSGIVNFNETEHLQRSFTRSLQRFWMWLTGWALTHRTVTTLFPPGPCTEWNRSQIKPHAHVLMVSSFRIALNAACILL